MNLQQSLLGLIAALSCLLPLQAQDNEPILLRNPSFEDMPRHSSAPIGWTDCGFPGESPPDVQPDPLNQFLVQKGPQHGNTYLGMVVRDNDTWEKISQRLSRPMEGGTCYEFKIFLARSEMYMSQSRISSEKANYVTPAKLRIYGGTSDCDKGQMLAESNVITSYRWLEYRFKLEPDADYTHLTLEAFYNTPTLFPYNGNILMDNASPLTPIPCEMQVVEDEPVVAAETPTPQRPQPQTQRPAPTRPQPKPAEPAQMLNPNTRISSVKREDIKVGQVFQIEDINFKTNSAEIDPSSRQVLDEVLQFMRSNKDVVVEIGGHTSGLAGDHFAQELSTDRAKAVVSYLVERGVDFRRLMAKGYGKSRQIATNDTTEGRRKNQRVEVKVIGFLQG